MQLLFTGSEVPHFVKAKQTCQNTNKNHYSVFKYISSNIPVYTFIQIKLGILIIYEN